MVVVVVAAAAVVVVVVIQEPARPVDVLTTLSAGRFGFGCQAEREVFLFFQKRRPPLKSNQPPTREVPLALSPVVEQLVREDEHLHLELRLRMSGFVPPFPAMTLRGAQT